MKAHKRKKHATNDEKLPEDAEIEVETMELPTEERVCPECGDEMREIGEAVTRKPKVVPAKIVVVEMHRKTYACANCEKNHVLTPIKTGPAGPAFLPGSMCLPEAVAYIMVQKYVMRKAEHPKNFLNGYAGYLHTVGYAGYHALPQEITVVGCPAHARRKFDEAPNDR